MRDRPQEMLVNRDSRSEIVGLGNIILRALMLLRLYAIFYNYFSEHIQYFSNWTSQFHSSKPHIIAIPERF